MQGVTLEIQSIFEARRRALATDVSDITLGEFILFFVSVNTLVKADRFEVLEELVFLVHSQAYCRRPPAHGWPFLSSAECSLQSALFLPPAALD